MRHALMLPMVCGYCLVLYSNVSVLQAAESEIAQEITTYLNEFASNDPDRQKSSDEQFTSLQAKYSGDARLYHARTLVCFEQRRFEEAAKTTDLLLGFDEHYLPAWRAKIWLALLKKNYGSAMTSAEQMAHSAIKLPEGEKKTATQAETARFLGTVFGFLTGPASDLPGAKNADALQKKVAEVLPAEHRAIFQTASQAVLDKYNSLINEKSDTKERAIADEEAEKQAQLTEVTEKRAANEERLTKLKSQQGEQEAKFRDELKQLEKQDSPLAAEQSRLEGTVITLQRELDILQTDIMRLESRLATEKDPRIRADLRFRLDNLSRTAARYDAEYGAIARSLQNVLGKRQQLDAEASQLRREVGGNLQKLERDQKTLQQEQRKLEGIERNVKKPATGVSGKAQALQLTAKALNTYEPYPLELEKASLLEELKK